MIQPNISLAVETPQVTDPLETAAKGLSIRGMQQQQQSGALALQQQRQDLADNQLVRQLYGKHKGDLDAVVKEAAGQVSPKTILGLQQSNIAHKEALAKLDETQLKNLESHNTLAANESGALLQKPPEQRAAEYPAAVARMVQSGAVKPGELPEQYPGDEPLQQFFDAHAGFKHVFEREKEQRAAKLAQNKDTREAAGEQRASMMAGPQLDKATAEAQSAQDKAAGKSPIQPEEQARLDLQQRAQEQTLIHNKATEQNATALLKVSQGNLGVAQEHAAIAKQIYEQTYGAGANPALVGVEPKLRVQASTAAQKAADEYTKTVESAANVQSFIDLAKKGNKAAGSNLPIMGAESIQALNGIKRINRSEIEQYQGAGSLLDKIQGRIGKLTSGQPIPKDVMDDIEALHKTMAGNAANTYNTKLGSINQNYRSNFQPVKVAGGESISVTDPNGGVHAFKTQADADAFKKAAGIK